MEKTFKLQIIHLQKKKNPQMFQIYYLRLAKKQKPKPLF